MNEFTKWAIIIPVVIIAIVWLTCIVVYIVHSIRENNEKERDLERYEDSITNDFNPDILNLLDNFINDCFREYRVTILIRNDTKYINDEDEQKIIHDLGSMVERRISPALIDKVCLYYNRDSINEIIASKVVMVVANYVIDTNKPKDSVEELDNYFNVDYMKYRRNDNS